MLNRGNVTWVEHDYKAVDRGALVTKTDGHPALCLLDSELSSAAGFQTVLLGTKRTASTAPGLSPRPYPLEFPARWENTYNKPASTLWKPYCLTVTSQLSRVDGFCPVTWDDDLKQALDAMLADEHVARWRLERSRLAARTPEQHPAIPATPSGSIANYGGSRVIVLSNKTLHECHPYGVLIAAPLISATAVQPPHPALAVGNERVALEQLQVIQPAADESFAPIPSPSLPKEDLLSLQNAAAAFLTNGAIPGCSRQNLIRYLREGQHERLARRLPLRLGSLREVADQTATPLLQVHRRAPQPRRAYTAEPVPILAGADRLRLAPESDLFRLYLSREENRITLSAGARIDTHAHNALRNVWLEDAAGEVLAFVGPGSLRPDGTALLECPPIVANQGVDLRVGLHSTLGVELFRLDLLWSTT